MAYSELIKNFSRIRDYMREFYVYGFKSREEFTQKSARSYDDERRRVESWLGDYMRFRQTSEGKNVFLSIDSRMTQHNPLYAAWKAKSFTDRDITLHFLLFDILHSPDISLTLNEIMADLDTYLERFCTSNLWDESTVRKKLKEYILEGLIVSEKKGKIMYYKRADDIEETPGEILDYFSEVSPCGVIGSFLLDKSECHESPFHFKHHYITSALDSEIVTSLFFAICEHRFITLETVNRRKNRITENHVVPLRLMISAQNGRQHLMAYVPRFESITSIRIDNILSIKADDVCDRFDELRDELNKMMPHIWGVSTKGGSERIEHMEFTVCYANDEQYVHNRLEREKRVGTVERLDDNSSRFFADVFDASEMVSWVRTFIGRITDFSCSNKKIEEKFKSDLQEMYALYGLEGGEENDIS